jgi:type IV pilus biogenesis protein CpaD/CtpE
MATVIGSHVLFAVAVTALSGCAGSTNTNGGSQLSVVETQVLELESTLGKRSARMQGLQQEMRHVVDALTAPDTDTTNRLFLIERTRSISEEQGRLQADIERLNAEMAVKRAQLETLRHPLTASS